MTFQGLSLGEMSFRTIIDSNMVYADKTKYIYDLIESHNGSFFLSRPCRFGKTLLLRMIQELFTGDRGRFEGLWINQSDYAFPYHPVLYLNMKMQSSTPQILSDNIVNNLRIIASNANLDVPTATPGMYLALIINSLYRSTNTKAVLLIDECDAPVISHMDDKGLAKANARILSDFLATLKDPNVSDHLHFTLVTGITRYPLISGDSGPNHFLDISLLPRFAGICGFTIEEFDSLFANRMESTLSRLKEAGVMPPASDSAELRSEILKWYDGYNFGFQTRVLNPYSILSFFYNGQFGPYWIQNDRPDHLTTLIRRRPMDFISLSPRPLRSTELVNTSLDQLQARQVLFYSGYLTLDTLIRTSSTDNERIKSILSFSFKFPNYEISHIYLTDCFCSLFNITPEELAIWGAELKQAFLTKDAETVTHKFKQYLSPNTYYERLDSALTFHIFVKLLLSCMGFKILSDDPDITGRLEIAIELPDSIFVLIELKYLIHMIKLNSETKNKLIYSHANRILSHDKFNAIIYSSIIRKIGLFEIRNICKTNNIDFKNTVEVNQFISSVSGQFLSQTEIEETIAEEVRRTLSNDEIEQIFRLESHKMLSKDQIDARLSLAAEEALAQIQEGDYHGPFASRAKEFIDLGLALYGDGLTIKAAFATK